MEKQNLTAEHIISVISVSEAFDKYKEFRAPILAGYFVHLTEVNPEQVIKTAEVAILFKWTFSKL